MSYIGNQPPDIGAYDVESFDGGGTSFTLKKSATTPSVLLFIDGVRQTPTDAYSVSGVTLTTTATTPSGTDNVTVMFMGDVVDIGAPSADTVSTAKIQDDAVTAAKLANSINTEIAANTAKVTNATHTGDVTGATALTIAVDAVDIAMLSATGSADATTFLRGDNAWAAPSGGKILQVGTATKLDTFSHNSATWVDVTDLSVTLTPAATSSKFLILSSISFGTSGVSGYVYFRLHSSEASGAVFIGDADGSRERVTWGGSESTSTSVMGAAHFSYVDSPSTVSAVTYKLQIYDQGGGTIVYVNRPYSDSDSASYTRGASSITVLEIGA